MMNTQHKKVLHILWDGGFGGAQKFVSDIIAYSDKSKFVHIVVFLTSGGWFGDQMIKDKTTVFSLGMKNGFSILKALSLLKVIYKIKPDLIHNHARNYLINMIVLMFIYMPKIYFEHGGDLIGDKPRREIIFYNCFSRFYDLILANSDYVKEEIVRLARIRPEKIKTFYIGINPEIYKDYFPKNELRIKFGIPETNKIIGTIGRIVAQKGFDDFIRVAVEMKKIDEMLSFIIIGDGPLKAALTKMTKDYGVEIFFLGDRNDVPQIIPMFDLFLITSKWEPFGIVVLEALASKVPVVGFSIPGMKEIFNKGGGGILLEERNHRKLAERAIDILNNREKYNKLSEEGRSNVVNNFNARKNIAEMERMYLDFV